ncbi:MAG: Na+/H+ antiporter NhaA [Acidimicrobiales bacterium]
MEVDVVDADEAEHTRGLQTWITSGGRVARHVGRPVQRFLHIEASGGIVLLVATVIALLWANFGGDSYGDFWSTEFSLDMPRLLVAEDLHGWVNDGLMVVFFFVVGLEIKREWVMGELRDTRAALMPGLAALGGMVVPALIYLAATVGTDYGHGWGIPMATDIAFALGVLALLGSRVPSSLKVFLLTLAIVDDIGAILVIAFVYSDNISFGWLAIAGVLLVVTRLMRYVGIWYMPAYVIMAGAIWLAVLESGVHATLAGVILGIMTPMTALNPKFSRRQLDLALEEAGDDPSRIVDASKLIRESVPVGLRLERAIHPWSSFVIIPIFALANAGIVLNGEIIGDAVTSQVTLGIVLGLIVGKVVGISGAVWLARRLGVGSLPAGSSFSQIVGVAAIAGIGFTVSLFITELAFNSEDIVSQAKIGVLAASVTAAVIGALILLRRSPAKSEPTEVPLVDP